MALSFVLLTAVFAVVNGRPELTNAGNDEELVRESGNTSTICSMNLEVVYPPNEGEPPSPLCSIWDLWEGGLWIEGVVFKRLSELEEYGLMVEMTYKNGSLRSCKMVPYDSAENFSARQEAHERCMESVSSRDKESQDEALVLSVTERITDVFSLTPLHQRLEGFTQVGNTYYRISPYTMSWHSAVKYCHQLGASLALIESSVEQNHLQGVLATDVWMDLNDIRTEGRYVNTRDTPITYTNWGPGEPNNQENEDCGMLHDDRRKLQWNDADCNLSAFALCEHPLVKEPQALYSCPPGYWQYGASCYILSERRGTYSRGEKFCSSNGAYPVFINSQGEQNYLVEKLPLSAFIGYTDRADEGRFISSRFGIPLFMWWRDQEPNDANNGEDCASIHQNHSLWNDLNCNSPIRMLCEKAADIRE